MAADRPLGKKVTSQEHRNANREEEELERS